MAQVERNPRDGGWLARWRDPTGRQRKKSFARRIDAQRWLDQHLAEMHRGAYVDPSGLKLSLGLVAGEWAGDLVHLKPSTRARYRNIVSRHIVPTWGSWRLGDIGSLDVERWIGELTRSGLQPSSVRQIHRVLSLILSSAVRHGRIGLNPATGLRLPRVVRGDPVYLDAEQVRRLAEAARPHDLPILVLAFTGLRFGELAALRARRVDLLRRRIHVVENVVEVQGYLEWGTPKTHQARLVPLPETLANRLSPILEGLSPADLVFTAPNGGVLRLRNWRLRVFDNACRQAGLAGLTPHDLRHTAASLAIASGANVKAVQRMLGHASAAMTLDVYAGLFGDDLDAVGVALDRHVPQMCHNGPPGAADGSWQEDGNAP